MATNTAGIATNVTAIGLNTTHRGSSGSEHADVATNTTHSGGDGSDHADVATNTAHLSSTGADHSYIDQDVTSTATPSFAGLTVAGAAAFSGPSETFVTFTDSDATPSVTAGNLFKTNTSGVTITTFDDGTAGQTVVVISAGAIVYDAASATLNCGTSNITTASGDVTTWVFDGTIWYLLSWMDNDADLSSGGF